MRKNRALAGVVALGFLGLITVIAFTGIFRAPFKPSTHQVLAEFARADQLRAGSQVRLEGQILGEVTDVSPTVDGDAARVTMDVQDDAGPIYDDARAEIKFKTLLGNAFFIAIDRGGEDSRELLADDGVIGIDHTSSQIEVEDLTSIFQEEPVRGMRTMLREFTTALSDPEQLPKDLRILNRIAPDAEIALNAIRGLKPDSDLRNLVRHTADTVEVLDTPTDQIRSLVAGAAATVQVTANRSEEIRQILREGPLVTQGLTTTLARLDGTLEIARGLIHRLDGPAPLIAPTLASLRPTLVDASALLHQVRPALHRFGTGLVYPGLAGGSGARLIRSLKGSLRKTDKIVLPYFHRKDPQTGKSTTVMIGGTAAGFGGAAAERDSLGRYVRFPAFGSSDSVFLPCSSSLVDPSADQQLACTAFNDALSTYFGYVPANQGVLP